MKKGQKNKLIFSMMFVLLVLSTIKVSAALMPTTSIHDESVMVDALSFQPNVNRADPVRIHASASTFTVSQNGWYILTVEINVSNQASTTTPYELQLDGQAVQSIIFNTKNTNVKTTVAAYLTSDSTHALTFSSSDVTVSSVTAVQAPTIQGSTLTTFAHQLNFLTINATLSLVFFVESSTSVLFEWASIGSLTITEVKLDEDVLSLENTEIALRNLDAGVPHNLTLTISGVESFLGGPPGLTITLKTLDETPPQLSNFNYGKGPVVGEKLFNLTITFDLEDAVSGLLVDSVEVKYITHDSETNAWDNTNRTATLVGVSSDNITFQYLIPSLKVTVDKVIVYITALDAVLNKLEVEQLIDLTPSTSETEAEGNLIPGFTFVSVAAVFLILAFTSMLSYHRRRRMQR